MSSQGVLVMGATGTQGGAVARQLLGEEFDVHALTREPGSREARRLAESGATIVEGDLYRPQSLGEAMEPVDAVFAITDFWDEGYDGEVTQGINLANVAVDTGIDHLVFSSVLGAGRETDVPVLDSKRRIETHIDRLDLPATVVRPSYFMQNFELRRSDILAGKMALPLAPGVRLPTADAMDVGRLAARAFASPWQYRGQTIPLAGEELMLGEMAESFADATNTDVQPVHVPIDVARAKAGDTYARLFEWYNDEPVSGVVADLERQHDFTPTSLPEYLHATDWVRRQVPERSDAPLV